MGKCVLAVVAMVAAMVCPGAASASSAAHRVTRPTVTYTEHFNATGQNCTSNGYYCWTSIKIDQNPSNQGVRAWESCVTNGAAQVNLGSWHYSDGTTSNTASCPIGEGVISAGFDWHKSSPHRVTCYTYPSPVNTGRCGG